MLTTFLAEQNFPFSLAIGLVLAIAVLEGVLTLLGFGLSALLDGFNADVDIPDADADLDVDADLDGVSGAGGSSLGSILAWLRFGEVPAIILLIIFLSAFGALGFALQAIVHSVSGFYLPAIIAVFPAFLAAMPAVRVFGGAMARLMPKEETSAVSRNSLIGRIATITLGTARAGAPAQGKVRDEHGLEHYVMIEPDVADETFAQGAEVLLVRSEGAVFFGIANTHAALSQQS
ncbi:MAG: YqiJ family protein [Pseudomonadota bacterium]